MVSQDNLELTETQGQLDPLDLQGLQALQVR